MKDPMKLARKEFPKYGAKLVLGTSRSQTWRMPWGEHWNVWPSAKLAMVRGKLDELKVRMDPLVGFHAAEAPPMFRPVASSHFLERVELMHQQEGLTPEQIRAACEEPTETRFCTRTGSYAYLRGDIAVLAAPRGQGIRLITVLWTKPDLWARNPRPETEAAYA